MQAEPAFACTWGLTIAYSVHAHRCTPASACWPSHAAIAKRRISVAPRFHVPYLCHVRAQVLPLPVRGGGAARGAGVCHEAVLLQLLAPLYFFDYLLRSACSSCMAARMVACGVVVYVTETSGLAVARSRVLNS